MADPGGFKVILFGDPGAGKASQVWFTSIPLVCRTELIQSVSIPPTLTGSWPKARSDGSRPRPLNSLQSNSPRSVLISLRGGSQSISGPYLALTNCFQTLSRLSSASGIPLTVEEGLSVTIVADTPPVHNAVSSCSIQQVVLRI